MPYVVRFGYGTDALLQDVCGERSQEFGSLKAAKEYANKTLPTVYDKWKGTPGEAFGYPEAFIFKRNK